MKGRDRMKTTVWMLVVALGFSALLQAAETEKSPLVLYQEALYQEETEGDLDKAIELYEQVLDEAAEVEHLAARSLYQLGMCHLKKGEKDAAADYFKKVVSEYPRQTSVVRKAKKQLEKIAPEKITRQNKQSPSKQITELALDDGKHEGKWSFSGGGHAVKFKAPSDNCTLKAVRIYGSRYGEYEVPKEDFSVWLCDTDFSIIKEFQFPYATFKKRGMAKWANLKVEPTKLPDEFILCVGFDPHRTKGIYLYHDAKASGNSFVGLPGSELDPFKDGDWLFRAIIEESGTQSEESSGLYDQATQAVWSVIGSLYGQTCAKAGMKHLYTNSNIHFVNSDLTHWHGGYGFYMNSGTEPVSGRIRLSGTTISSQKHYDIMGNPLDTEIVPDERPGRERYYNIYLNLPQPIPSGQFYPYGWAIDGSNQLQQMPFSDNGKYILVMQNHFGSHAFQVFYLVLPNDLTAEYEEQPTDKKTVGDYIIYAWEKEVQPDDNHVVTVNLSKTRELSPKELSAIVEKAVLIISTCAETDPRLKEAMESLEGIQEEPLVAELANYLDSETATIRRSAVYVLWKGGFSDISAAQEKLLELCSHEENFTRGMTALALGEHKIAAAYDTLVEMTLNDKDGYARRCGAYALGLLGDEKALPVLEQALQDPEDFVKQNAQAAITMLTKLNDEESVSNEPEPQMTQEMYNDIQPDGTIFFKNPNPVVNTGTEPITERRFINSDFVQLTNMTDEQGNPVEFTAKHEGSIYRYHVTFDPPIMPGETFVYTSEGTINGLVNPVANQPDTYRYMMTHSPASGVPTLRIEEYLLPEGAELVSMLSEGMKQSTKDRRILLRVEKVIPANGSLTTSFKYKLTK